MGIYFFGKLIVKNLLRHRDRVVFPRIGPCLFIGDVCLNAYEQNTETDESFDVSHRMQNITWCTHNLFFSLLATPLLLVKCF